MLLSIIILKFTIESLVLAVHLLNEILCGEMVDIEANIFLENISSSSLVINLTGSL